MLSQVVVVESREKRASNILLYNKNVNDSKIVVNIHDYVKTSR